MTSSEQDAALLAAVEQACREQTGNIALLRRYATEKATDKTCISYYGAIGTRIAYILQQENSAVRRHLMRLARDGKVLRPEKDCRGGAVRWWPVGLLDKLRAEWAAETQTPA